MPTVFFGNKPDTDYEEYYIHYYPKVGYLSEVTGVTDDNLEHPKETDTTQYNPDHFDTDELLIQEKIDGGNFRIRIEHGEPIIYGSRKHVLGTDPTTFNGFFQRPAKHIENTLTQTSIKHVTDEYGPLTIFGENMLYHSIDYNWENVPPFIVFDIWSHNTESFLHFDTTQEIATQLGFETIPIIDRVHPNNLSVDDYAERHSHYGENITAEGIVIKDYTNQSFAKHVNKEFHEINTKRWGETQRDSETGKGLYEVDYTKYLNAKYVTNQRIEKHIRKHVIENGELSMKITKPVIKDVYTDIWEEHLHDIITSGQTIDTSRLHQYVAERVRERLRAIVRNRELLEDIDDDITDAKYLDLMAIGEGNRSN